MNLLENPNLWSSSPGGSAPPDSWQGTAFELSNGPAEDVALNLYLLAPYGSTGDVVQGQAFYGSGTFVNLDLYLYSYPSFTEIGSITLVRDHPPTPFSFVVPPGEQVLLQLQGGGYDSHYFIEPGEFGLVANDDSAITSYNTSVNIDVLANDSLDGEVPTVAEVDVSLSSPPSNGTAQLMPDGSFTYTPNPGFYGTDTFEYEITEIPPVSCDSTIVFFCDTEIVSSLNIVEPGWVDEADFSIVGTGWSASYNWNALDQNYQRVSSTGTQPEAPDVVGNVDVTQSALSFCANIEWACG